MHKLSVWLALCFKTTIGTLINYFRNNLFIMLSGASLLWKPGRPFPGSQGVPSLETRASLPWKPGRPFPGSQGVPSLEARASLPWKPGRPFPGSQGVPSLETRASLPWKPGRPFPGSQGVPSLEARANTRLSRTYMNENYWFRIKFVQTLLKQQICFHKMSKIIYIFNLYSKLNIYIYYNFQFIYIYIYNFQFRF